MENRKRIIISVVSIFVIFISIYVFYGRERVGNSPRDVVYKFLTTKGMDDKKIYLESYSKEYDVFFEDKINNLSESFTKNKFSYVLEQDVNWEELEEGEYARVKVFKNKDNGIYEDTVDIFYLKKDEDSFKIDIGVMVTKSDISLNDFILSKDKNKRVFKVYARMDNYNNTDLFDIAKKVENNIELTEEEEIKYIPKKMLEEINKYYSLTIKDPVTNLQVQGIMEKSYEINNYTSKYLKDGGFKEILLELSVVEVNELNTILKIDSIKSLDWSMVE
ncbi:hypothetical protein [Clostridium sp.]|uniref:hypothetical protein n=1 Tax=Clostridium sp. TaxID=1506 RepID=UPI0026170D12|nr:hypothetical protein [Clostridium sp.]